MSPRHSLAAVRAAIEVTGGLHMGKGACRERLMKYLDSVSECIAFCKVVLKGLTPADFCQTVPLDDRRKGTTSATEDFDEYGVRMEETTLEPFGLGGKNTWYIKLTLRSTGQDSVLLLSLHRLEKVMTLENGTILTPEW